MARFIPLTESEVTFEVTLEEEHIPVRGNAMASGDDAADTACENEILERLERGQLEAWCTLVVTCTYTAPNGKEYAGRDVLGAVSLEGGSGRAVAAQAEQHARDYSMHKNALLEVNAALQADHAVKVVRMVETKYLGPTDTRGSRVRARHLTTRKTVTVAWDHELDAFENHASAAEKLLGRRPEFSTSVDGGGYVMGVDPRNDLTE